MTSVTRPPFQVGRRQAGHRDAVAQRGPSRGGSESAGTGRPIRAEGSLPGIAGAEPDIEQGGEGREDGERQQGPDASAAAAGRPGAAVPRRGRSLMPALLSGRRRRRSARARPRASRSDKVRAQAAMVEHDEADEPSDDQDREAVAGEDRRPNGARGRCRRGHLRPRSAAPTAAGRAAGRLEAQGPDAPAQDLVAHRREMENGEQQR